MPLRNGKQLPNLTYVAITLGDGLNADGRVTGLICGRSTTLPRPTLSHKRQWFWRD